MKKKLSSFLRITIPLALGVFLIWYMFKDMSDEDIDNMIMSFKMADYKWIFLSLIMGVLSHWSRAYRWLFTLEPIGIKPKLSNAFYTVMIGYLANLLIPRAGEVSRCAFMAKHEKAPFDKLFGTVIAERIADLILLVSLIFITIISQYDILFGFIQELSFYKKLQQPANIIITVAILGLIAFLLYRLIKRSNQPLIIKLRTFISGIKEGVLSILRMKKVGWFLFHTFFIWGMYLGMFWITIYCLPELENLSFGAILSGFVIGGISIAATNGGLGAYPLGIMTVLALYGIQEQVGLAFGWIVWVAQTAMIIILGLASFILIEISNKSNVKV